LDASYRIKKLTLFAVLNNVTNRQYYTNGLITASGTPGYFIQAPVNVYGGLRLTIAD
jgi:outer membrane receptor protein involved in Fe transport